MKKLIVSLSFATLALCLLAACGEQQKAPEAAKPSAQGMQPAPAPQAASPGKSGKVVETMNAAGYTYVHQDQRGALGHRGKRLLDGRERRA